jgi:hypothetical protein
VVFSTGSLTASDVTNSLFFTQIQATTNSYLRMTELVTTKFLLARSTALQNV